MNLQQYRRIRLCLGRNLIFFVLIMSACQPVASDQTEIIWEANRAVGISLPVSRIAASGRSLSDALQVRIKSGTPVKMLGTVEEVGQRLIFRPLVPLTRGLSYEVLVDDQLIETITIPAAERAEALNLEIFPSQDTVPENLLKIYLKFSRPMQEGRALEYLTLLDHNGDTLEGTFLDL